LWLYQRIFFGEITNPANAKLPDLTFREQLTLIPLVILALWIGLYPAPILRVIRRPSERIVQIVGGATAEAPAMAEKAPAAQDAAAGAVAAHP
jgi:NADH-quinone oxidoreductase subunit M